MVSATRQAKGTHGNEASMDLEQHGAGGSQRKTFRVFVVVIAIVV